MSNFKSVIDYFNDAKAFIIPYYQRGYKWSLQTNKKRNDTHLNLLLSDLLEEFKNAKVDDNLSPTYEYYLQGITVKEKGDITEIIDGQQRTTTLFILLSCLQNAGISKNIPSLEGKIHYQVRKAANILLHNFIDGKVEGDETIQDIAALIKAWIRCNNYVNALEEPELYCSFLLNNVKIIYITLDNTQKEAEVFSMMNESKAEMTQSDLVKSNILREASRQIFGDLFNKVQLDGLEWQINQLRSKLAVEWDNWRKWWENEKHLEFGRMISLDFPSSDSEEPNIAVILKFYAFLNNTKLTDIELFEYFKKQILKNNSDKISAIEVFNKLRLIQGIIEEWYSNHEIYNLLGLLFKGSGLKDKTSKVKKLFLNYKKDKNNFILYIKDQYIKEIVGDTEPEVFVSNLMNDKNVYLNHYNNIARQLLRINVLLANKQKQKFDYSLYEENNFKTKEEISEATRRSLEHIKPQKYRNNKIDEKERQKLKELTNTAGNLVLIPKGLNSILSNKNPVEKKSILFNKILEPEGKNFGLWLHTLQVFGKMNNWDSSEIKKNALFLEHDLRFFFNIK